MIAHLRGVLLVKKPGLVVLEVGGVGYKVFIPLSTYYELDGEGSVVSFRVHTHVREDTIALYGFLTEIEEAIFERLIAVAGVGPSLALKILSGLEPGDLVETIRRGDSRRLCSVPGVGRKTAERVIVELRDKMPLMVALVGEPAVRAGVSSSGQILYDDLLSALINLGYQKNQADRVVDGVLRDQPGLSFEAALKKALRHLSG